MVLNQNYEQVVDPKIPQLPPLKELKRILLIALRCADLVVENRPKMGEVIHMLEPRDLLLSDVSTFHISQLSIVHPVSAMIMLVFVDFSGARCLS